MDVFDTLTPLQQLVLECLAARFRLGHNLWTFRSSSALSKAMKALESAGYVVLMDGVIQGTVRASLTEEGKKVVLDPGYTPPR